MPLPKLTVGRLMLGIAAVAICCPVLIVLQALDPLGWLTVYSPNYSESRFESLTPGMTASQVESVMGKPLRRVPWQQRSGATDEEMWYYSNHRANTANFWRRWVYFKGGKSIIVIKDFWID